MVQDLPPTESTSGSGTEKVAKECFFDVQKPELLTADVDQSIEAYKWLIPVGNVRSILSQLHSLKQSVDKESGIRSIVDSFACCNELGIPSFSIRFGMLFLFSVFKAFEGGQIQDRR